MTLDQFLQSAQAPALIVPDAIAASQWEAHLDRIGASPGGAVWLSPPITPLAGFIEDLWRDEGDGTSLLSTEQSRALWRTVVEESSLSDRLVGTASAAAWAETAWRLIGNWGIDSSRLRADETQLDFAAFLEWCRGYRERLREERWIDPTQALRAINASSVRHAGDLGLLDLADRGPEIERLLARHAETGRRVLDYSSPTLGADVHAMAAEDQRDELAQAAAWLKEKLVADPKRALALVVPDLEERRHEVRALLDDTLEGITEPSCIWLQRGPRLTDIPAFGDALRAIEMLTPEGDYFAFSRWLLSASFHDLARLQRSALTETRLRARPEVQAPFIDEYLRGGLRPVLARDVPEASAGLDAAIARVERVGRRASPSRWAGAWQEGLHDLGWRVVADLSSERNLDAWASALQRFAELSPITGDISAARAAALFAEILRSTDTRASLPYAGVHVFEHARHVGPGYGGVWLAGFTDRRWPEPEAPNPLLPRRLQVEHRMPSATSALASERSRRTLERLLGCAPEVVVSWPAHIDEEIVEPSAMLERLDLHAEALRRRPTPPRYAERRMREGSTELLEDRPPPLGSERVPGGTRTLDLQAACPIRAFCEARLGARPLERPARGLPPRLVGQVVHRALELALRPALASNDVFDPLARLADVESCVARALAELCRWRHPIGRMLVELEQRRTSERIRAFLLEEASRAPFRLEAMEQPIDVEVAGARVTGRIDRLDHLDDGRIAILDYKTGTRTEISGWFAERLRDCQLPLYALAEAQRASGLVKIAFRAAGVEYRGCADSAWEFPGGVRTLPDRRSWPAQVEAWREQLRVLVDEFAAGDARILMSDTTLAEGAYAPLTRVYEQPLVVRAVP